MKVLLIEAKKDLLKMKIKKGDLIYFRFQIKRNNNKLCLIPISVYNSTSNTHLDFKHKFNIFFNGKIYSVQKTSEKIDIKKENKNQICQFPKKKQIFVSPSVFPKKNKIVNIEKFQKKENKNEIQIYKNNNYNQKTNLCPEKKKDLRIKNLNESFDAFHISELILDEDNNDIVNLFRNCSITQSKKRKISKKNKKYN